MPDHLNAAVCHVTIDLCEVTIVVYHVTIVLDIYSPTTGVTRRQKYNKGED